MLILWSNDPVRVNKFVSEYTGNFKVWTNPTLIPEHQPGDVILTFGLFSKELLYEEKLIQKGRTITSLRTTAMALDTGGWLMMTYPLSVEDNDHSKFVDVQVDLNLALRMVETGSLEPKFGDYQYMDDFQEELQGIVAQAKSTHRPVAVAVDLETLGLDPYKEGAWIISISITYKIGRSRVIYFEKGKKPTPGNADWNTIYHVLNANYIRVVGSNLKFDLTWIKEHWGIDCTNDTYNTDIIGSLLDEERSNGLKSHAKIYTKDFGGYSDYFDAKFDKARMDLVPMEELLVYAGADTDANLRVAKPLVKELFLDPKLRNFYSHILHPATKVFRKVERCGVYIDRPYYDQFGLDLETEIADLTKSAQSYLPPHFYYKYQKSKAKSAITPKMLTEFLFTDGKGIKLTPQMFTEKSTDENPQPSTAKEHLQMFADHPKAGDFIKTYLAMRATEKMHSTYYVGFLKHLRDDGKLHPSYFLHNSGEDDGGTRCFPPGELILTNKGYIPIEEVRVGMEVVSHTGTPRPVVAFVGNGIKEVYQVTLQNGLVLRTTGNHPFLTQAGWVAAANLRPGDMVLTHSDPEEWRPIDGWPYDVSSWGRVRRTSGKDAGRILTQREKGHWGHLKVTLSRNGAQSRDGDKKDAPVHRLVAQAFVPNPDTLPEVRHKNGIAWDNTAGNLAWGSSSDNTQDGIRHGTMLPRNQGRSKITEEDVRWVRATPISTRGEGWTNERIANHLGVCKRLVRAIRAGSRWKEYPVSPPKAEFCLSAVRSLIPLGPARTYGIMVDVDHSHVSGGIVTHNTGRLSARDPAFQCMVGETEVLTSQGTRRLDWLVEHQGAGLKVLTHTGKWRDIVGVYRNGVQPVFEVTTSSGRSIICTGNHPILTDGGWVRTAQLKEGVSCYVFRPPNEEVHQPHLLLVGRHEEPVPVSDFQGLEEHEAPDRSTFQEDIVLSIRLLGIRETFDLTIDRSHSFIANGVVVHNTVPKHSVSAKKLRKAFNAPPGYVILAGDYCLAGDTLVDTVHGPIPIKDVRVGEGVFTIQKDGNPIVCTVEKTINAGMLGAWEIVLDTGEKIICSGDHDWLSFDGVKVKTFDLLPGFRMMPSRRVVQGAKGMERPRRYSKTSFNWNYEHHLVAAWLFGDYDKETLDIHHKDHNRMNNTPENLELVPKIDHKSHHGKRWWNSLSPEDQKSHMEKVSQGYEVALKKGMSFKGENNPRYGTGTGETTNCLVCGADVYSHPSYVKKYGPRKYCGQKCYFEDKRGRNHKVVSVRNLEIQIPMYCLTVEGEHTFALSCGVVSGNCQGELKIAACLANEKYMIQAYLNGIDLHAATSARISGITLEEMMALKEFDSDKYDALRQLGKAANFGLIYGMSAPSYRLYAQWSYGVVMSEADAFDQRDAFFEAYPGLIPWHETYKKYARKYKMVYSPLGRIRHLPLIVSNVSEVRAQAERQAVNSPVQSTLSDFSLWVLSILDDKYGFDPKLDGGICSFGQVHDQLLFYVPEVEAGDWAVKIKHEMENLPIKDVCGWNPQLKFTVDFEKGPTLGDLKKFKVAA